MPAKRNGYNRSGPLRRLHNERPATWAEACSHRGRPADVCASLQTRSRFAGSLRGRGDGIERMLVDGISVVVAYVKPFLALFAGNVLKEDTSDLGG